MAKNDEQTGWWALYLAITQDLSAGRALAVINGRGKRLQQRLSWPEFVARAIEAERLSAERRRLDARSERARAYQREYQRRYRAQKAIGSRQGVSPGCMGEQHAKRATSPGCMGEQHAKRATSRDAGASRG